MHSLSLNRFQLLEGWVPSRENLPTIMTCLWTGGVAARGERAEVLDPAWASALASLSPTLQDGCEDQRELIGSATLGQAHHGLYDTPGDLHSPIPSL